MSELCVRAASVNWKVVKVGVRKKRDLNLIVSGLESSHRCCPHNKWAIKQLAF